MYVRRHDNTQTKMYAGRDACCPWCASPLLGLEKNAPRALLMLETRRGRQTDRRQTLDDDSINNSSRGHVTMVDEYSIASLC